MFYGQVFAWLPPLVFTVMNEDQGSLFFGGMHINEVYCSLAIIYYQFLRNDLEVEKDLGIGIYDSKSLEAIRVRKQSNVSPVIE